MGLWHGLGRPFENSGAPHVVWGFVQRGSALFYLSCKREEILQGYQYT
jgi:hypothetical protein